MTSPWMMAASSGAALALASSLHCMTMCGPLAAASQARAGAHTGLHYLFGRLVSYTLLGSLAGSFGQALATTRWGRWVEAALAWTLALLLLRSALRLFAKPRERALVQLGTKPRRNRVAALLVRVADDPLLLGAMTALLPCAALYAAVLASAAFAQASLGALCMFSFGLATSPVLLGGAQLARLANAGRSGRRWFAALLVAGALITALRPMQLFASDAQNSCPLHAAQMGAH